MNTIIDIAGVPLFQKKAHTAEKQKKLLFIFVESQFFFP